MTVPIAALKPRSERGVVAVLTLPLLGVVTVMTVALAALGAVVVAERQVQSAADLAALAGAAAAQRGHDACAAAARLARHGRAEVVACELDGAAVSVVAAIELRALLGRQVTVRARARAGPVTDVPAQAGGR